MKQSLNCFVEGHVVMAFGPGFAQIETTFAEHHKQQSPAATKEDPSQRQQCDIPADIPSFPEDAWKIGTD